jgi:hypothetical protein
MLMMHAIYLLKSKKWKHVLYQIKGPAPKLKLADCPLKGDIVGLLYKRKQLWFKVVRREFVYHEGKLNNVRFIVKRY